MPLIDISLRAKRGCACLLFLLTIAMDAGAQSAREPTAPAPSAAIPYKKAEEHPGSDAWRVLGTLAVLLVISGGALWYLKRKYPGFTPSGGSQRIQLIERRSLSPKLALYLVSIDGKEILFTHSGDRVCPLPTRATQTHVERTETL